MFFLLLAIAALCRQSWRGGEPLDLARVPRFLALAASTWIGLAIVSLAWSVDAGYTLAELRREILYGALAFIALFAGTRTPAQLHLWVAMLFGGALLLGIGEWLRFLLPGVSWARTVSMGPGPYSTQVVLLAPLLVILAWRAPVGLARGLGVTLAAGATLVVAGIAGDSRILWVALLASAVTAFAAFWMMGPLQPASRRLARRALFLALVLLPALMLIATEYKLRYYPGAASTLESFALDERPIIWKVAAAFAAERPWLGHGYGREIIGGRFREELGKVVHNQPYHHGHNVVLDAQLQMGVPGVAAFALLMTALAMGFLAAGRREGGAPLAIVGLAMLAGYLTKSMTDDFFFRPNSLVFWAIAGMLLGLAARLPQKR